MEHLEATRGLRELETIREFKINLLKQTMEGLTHLHCNNIGKLLFQEVFMDANVGMLA